MTSAPNLPRHTIVVELRDQPGVLYRAIGLIRRRGYNVPNLTVGPTERDGISRMVLVVEAADVRHVVQQLRRLVDVLAAREDVLPTESGPCSGSRLTPPISHTSQEPTP